MKKNHCFLFLTMCMLLTACSSQYKEIEVQSATAGAAGETVEASTSTATPETTGSQAEPSAAASPAGLIKDQTFDVTLDGWGNVTFASFMPEKNESMDGDVQFKLMKNGDVSYTFPGVSEDNRLLNSSYKAVDAVAFKDYNRDGKTDIIIISEYVPRPDDNTGKGYHEVRVYTQKDHQKEFTLDSGLDEFLMKNYDSDSIDAVLKGIAEYQDTAFAAPGYYGSYRVTGLKGTAAVSAMPDEEINEQIGKTLSYGEDSIAFGDTVIDVTPDAYQEESYQTDQFSTDFKITASALGITAKYIQAVSVQTEENYFGNYFFAVDSDTLLVYYEGAFFEAKRI